MDYANNPKSFQNEYKLIKSDFIKRIMVALSQIISLI